MSHFNVSLIAWAKSQNSVHKPQFLKRERKAETDRTEVLLLTSLAPYRWATSAQFAVCLAQCFHKHVSRWARVERVNSKPVEEVVPDLLCRESSPSHNEGLETTLSTDQLP